MRIPSSSPCNTTQSLIYSLHIHRSCHMRGEKTAQGSGSLWRHWRILPTHCANFPSRVFVKKNQFFLYFILSQYAVWLSPKITTFYTLIGEHLQNSFLWSLNSYYAALHFKIIKVAGFLCVSSIVRALHTLSNFILPTTI